MNPLVPAPPVAAGTIVAGYRLERRVGAGGAGEVWLGRHVTTGGTGAVKLLRPDAGERAREYFSREGRVVARLAHPHIVALFDISAEAMVTEFIDGQDLDRRLRSPLDASVALRIAREIASALAHAHRRGVVHRDVKPSNILLDGSETAYLADFGVAAFSDELAPQRVAGTPGFMAPEQARGLAGPLSDQFSLGRTLLAMLSIEATDVAGRLPEPLLAVINRATHPEVRERWPSMEAFADALEPEMGEFTPPPVQVRERRSSRPFAWASAPRERAVIGVDIERADYRLSDLDAAGLLDARDFRAATGYADFGWSMLARSARLGRLASPSALARAEELVVLMHGGSCTRDVWELIGPAVCRDNAQAVVLAPDLHGFGMSPFARPCPDRARLSTAGLVRAVFQWLTLLGLRNNMPTVLVGHSMSAVALLSITAAEAGVRTSRVAITPVFPYAHPSYRRRLRAGAAICATLGRFTPFKRWLAAVTFDEALATAELAASVRAKLDDEFARAPADVLAGSIVGIADATALAGSSLDRVVVLLGGSDPLAPEHVATTAIAKMGLSGGSVQRLATGGHYPHLESADHPEWTHRNVAEIIHHIDSMLLTARHATLHSLGEPTLVALPGPG